MIHAQIAPIPHSCAVVFAVVVVANVAVVVAVVAIVAHPLVFVAIADAAVVVFANVASAVVVVVAILAHPPVVVVVGVAATFFYPTSLSPQPLQRRPPFPFLERDADSLCRRHHRHHHHRCHRYHLHSCRRRERRGGESERRISHLWLFCWD